MEGHDLMVSIFNRREKGGNGDFFYRREKEKTEER
jgi:hypothetical protein